MLLFSSRCGWTLTTWLAPLSRLWQRLLKMLILCLSVSHKNTRIVQIVEQVGYINVHTRKLHAVIQKVLSEGVQLQQRSFFDERRESKHHFKRAIIGPPEKRHLNGVSLVYRCWHNIEGWLGSFVIFQVSRPISLKNPIFL